MRKRGNRKKYPEGKKKTSLKKGEGERKVAEVEPNLLGKSVFGFRVVSLQASQKNRWRVKKKLSKISWYPLVWV